MNLYTSYVHTTRTDDGCTISIEASDILKEICGVNDRHLAIMEELFSSTVNVRGNILYLETDDQSRVDKFVSLVKELGTMARDGRPITAEIIRSIASDDEASGREIEIPLAGTVVMPRGRRQTSMVAGFDRYALSFCIGPAGTGKTFLAVAHALREVLSRRYRKLILTRPVVEAGENLGYLPGDLSQKISPYLHPLYDAIEALLNRDLIVRMQDQGTIEVAPLAYMRGRNLRDSYVILDEGQNTTREQMKMFLSRIGEKSKAVVTGDITQIDLPNPTKSGLIHALKVLEKIPEIGITYLRQEDIIRSTLVRRIIKAYDEYRE